MIGFSRLDYDWEGETVWIVGGGSSLEGFDLNNLKGKGITLGVNKAAYHSFKCDYCFTLDQTFYKRCYQELKEYDRTVYCALPPTGKIEPLPKGVYLERRRNQKLSENNFEIYGHNSGFGALGLAFLKGASRINLLGFDMCNKGNKVHWHSSYEWHNPKNHSWYNQWAANFDNAAIQLEEAEIEVVNYVGDPESTIGCFNKEPLENI